MTPWDWIKAVRSSDLKSTEKLVAAVLFTYMAPDCPRCWPSLNTLAADTGYHRSTVKRALSALEEQGWVGRAPRRKGRVHDSTIYTTRVGAGSAQAHEAPAQEARGEPTVGAGGADGGRRVRPEETKEETKEERGTPPSHLELLERAAAASDAAGASKRRKILSVARDIREGRVTAARLRLLRDLVAEVEDAQGGAEAPGVQSWEAARERSKRARAERDRHYERVMRERLEDAQAAGSDVSELRMRLLKGGAA